MTQARFVGTCTGSRSPRRKRLSPTRIFHARSHTHPDTSSPTQRGHNSTLVFCHTHVVHVAPVDIAVPVLDNTTMFSVAGKAGKKSKRNLFWKQKPTKAGEANEAKNLKPCREDAAQGDIPHVVVSGMISLSGDAPQSPTGPETSGQADPSATFVGTLPAERRTEMNEVVADAPDGPSCKVPDKIVMPGVVSGMSILPGDVQPSTIDAGGGSGTLSLRLPCELSEGSSRKVHQVREDAPPTLELGSSPSSDADQDKSSPSESVPSESVPAAEVTIGSEMGVVAADVPGKSSVEKKEPKTDQLASSADILPEDHANTPRSVMAADACAADNAPTPNVDGSPRVSAACCPSTLSVDGADASGSAPTLLGKAGISAPTAGGVGRDSRAGTVRPSAIESAADVVGAGAPDVPSTGTKKPKRGVFSKFFGSSKGKIECQPAGAVPSSKGPEKLSLAPKKPSFDNVSGSSKLDTKGPRPKGRYVVVSGMIDTSDENTATLAQSSSEEVSTQITTYVDSQPLERQYRSAYFSGLMEPAVRRLHSLPRLRQRAGWHITDPSCSTTCISQAFNIDKALNLDQP
ncbi:unnamed protein product [Scytosiphon promiscuus]